MYNRQQIIAIGLYTRSTLDYPSHNSSKYEFGFIKKYPKRNDPPPK